MNGLDPIEIHKILEKLKKEKKIEKKSDLWSVIDKGKNNTIILSSSDSHSYLKEYMGYFEFLKLPHPLDFEWRNSTSSLNYLVNLIDELNRINDNVLLLGMPTLFATCIIKDINPKITLIEKNKPIVQSFLKLKSGKKHFNILESDIFNINPKVIGKYHCIVMDPPWYSLYFLQFMWLAAQCIEIGGIIGISLPPIVTRPNIDIERIEWFTFCQNNGLVLENLYANKLHYAMPFFEFNAFRAAGIEDIFPFWRKGDLAIFRKIHSNSTERPVYKENKLKWLEKEFQNVRVRFKNEDKKIKDNEIRIEHLIKGDILPSVSSRDERRKDANIWTSGNRIFKVNNVNKLFQLLGKEKIGNSRKKELNFINQFFNTIIELEKKEYNNYLEWLYYEMEKQVD